MTAECGTRCRTKSRQRRSDEKSIFKACHTARGISGTSPLIPEYADTFAKHTDVPAHIWTGLTDEDLKALERMGR